MMKNAWDKKRVEDYIITYGPPDNPKPRSKNRFIYASKKVAGNSVLDLGCGPGYLYPFLHSHPYKGIDSSLEMIETARRYFSPGNFEVGDVYDLSGEEIYDTVISMSLLIHIEHKDLNHVIEEMWNHSRKALVFTIPIDKDFSKIVGPRKTVSTHVSHKTLDNLLKNFKPEIIEKNPFPKGCFGYGLNDYLVKAIKAKNNVAEE